MPLAKWHDLEAALATTCAMDLRRKEAYLREEGWHGIADIIRAIAFDKERQEMDGRVAA